MNRHIAILIVQCTFAVLSLGVNAIITVPTYSLVTHMGEHQKKKQLLDVFRMKKALHKAGGNVDGGLKHLTAEQQQQFARMQNDGTFAGDKAKSLGDAIESMALKSEQLQKAQENTMKLINMAAEMSSVDEIDKLFTVVCEDAKNLTHSDRATLFLCDDENREVWSLIAQGIPPIRCKMSEGIIGACVVGASVLNIPDAYEDDRFNSAFDKKTGYKTNNILCIPILDAKTTTVLGAMQIINKLAEDGVAPEPFTLDDQKLMAVYCKVVANSIKVLNKNESTLTSIREQRRVSEQNMTTLHTENSNIGNSKKKAVKKSQVAPEPVAEAAAVKNDN